MRKYIVITKNPYIRRIFLIYRDQQNTVARCGGRVCECPPQRRFERAQVFAFQIRRYKHRFLHPLTTVSCE